MAIELIVGLGNPGPNYSQTRHNAGFWCVDYIAKDAGGQFRAETKMLGDLCSLTIGSHSIRLLKPTTYMNHCGQSVRALSDYYKIATENILIVHDDIDLQPGTVKLKKAGGHGGHNGLRDCIAHLGSPAFQRLRLGVGHPGSAKEVVDYVLRVPSKTDLQLIDDKIRAANSVLADIIAGHTEKAMQILHTK